MAGREILEVLISLALMLLVFTWVGYNLFKDDYRAGAGAGGDANVNVDLSSFPRALQSLLVLLTTANFPDVMLPAYNADRSRLRV